MNLERISRVECGFIKKQCVAEAIVFECGI